jgi:hypothetical protein
MFRLLGRQSLVTLAAVAGGIGLCVILVTCSPSGTLQTTELQGTTTIASTVPTGQPTTLASTDPTATDTQLPMMTRTPAAPQTATPTDRVVPSPTATSSSTAPSPTTPTDTSTPWPTASPLPTVTPGSAVQARQAIIADHFSTDITTIPQAWIEEAKRELHIAYGHTSHGSQLTTGMAGLVDFAKGGGLGLLLPENIFQFSPGGNDGGGYLHLFEGSGTTAGDLELDLGYYPGWVDETRAYLGAPDPVTDRGSNHPEMNVVIWSWCTQASTYTEQQMLDQYLLPMTQLEQDYPGITFVYMTGHADGTGEEGNLHLRNQQIREYCIQNGKVLYDFYDIELYDPDGNYYGDKLVNGQCDYDSDGNGILDRIWCLDWQNRHVEGVKWYTCDCSHSYPINCNQKAYAAWWLWARLAGWDGN